MDIDEQKSLKNKTETRRDTIFTDYQSSSDYEESDDKINISQRRSLIIIIVGVIISAAVVVTLILCLGITDSNNHSPISSPTTSPTLQPTFTPEKMQIVDQITNIQGISQSNIKNIDIKTDSVEIIICDSTATDIQNLIDTIKATTAQTLQVTNQEILLSMNDSYCGSNKRRLQSSQSQLMAMGPNGQITATPRHDSCKVKNYCASAAGSNLCLNNELNHLLPIDCRDDPLYDIKNTDFDIIVLQYQNVTQFSLRDLENSKVTTLDANYNEITIDRLKALTWNCNANAINLRELQLGMNKLGSAQVLMIVTYLPALNTLELAHNEIDDINRYLDILQQSKTMRVLGLGGNNIENIELDQLQGSVLEILNLISNKIQSIDLNGLSDTVLKHLWLQNNQITSIDLSPLQNSVLNTLKLTGNPICNTWGNNIPQQSDKNGRFISIIC